MYLKRLKSSKFVRVKAFPMYGGIGVSAPSLHRESTDSLITGILTLSTENFTLHTEPSVHPPEFTITCHTQGGPATTVKWTANGTDVSDNSDYESSQVIVDTSRNSVYENRLRVRGRHSGLYFCLIKNNQQLMFTACKMEVKGV